MAFHHWIKSISLRWKKHKYRQPYNLQTNPNTMIRKYWQQKCSFIGLFLIHIWIHIKISSLQIWDKIKLPIMLCPLVPKQLICQKYPSLNNSKFFISNFRMVDKDCSWLLHRSDDSLCWRGAIGVNMLLWCSRNRDCWEWFQLVTLIAKILGSILTHLPLDKRATISQTIFSDEFSWMKSFVFWLKFHWSLFLRVPWKITQHWFR